MNALRIAASSDASFEQNEMPTPRVEVWTLEAKYTDERLDESLAQLRENLESLEEEVRIKTNGPTRIRELKIDARVLREKVRRVETIRATPIEERVHKPWLVQWARDLEVLEQTYAQEKASVKALRDSGRKSVPTVELEFFHAWLKELRRAVKGLTPEEERERMLRAMND